MITLKEARKLTVEVVSKTDAAKIVDKYVRRAIEDGSVQCTIPKDEYSKFVSKPQFLLAIRDMGFWCWPLTKVKSHYDSGWYMPYNVETDDIVVKWGLSDDEQKPE